MRGVFSLFLPLFLFFFTLLLHSGDYVAILFFFPFTSSFIVCSSFFCCFVYCSIWGGSEFMCVCVCLKSALRHSFSLYL